MVLSIYRRIKDNLYQHISHCCPCKTSFLKNNLKFLFPHFNKDVYIKMYILNVKIRFRTFKHVHVCYIKKRTLAYTF